MRLWYKGRKMSATGKANISAATKGDNNHFYGKRHSDETRRKMSENHADFNGDNNPFSKAIARDPSLLPRLSQERQDRKNRKQCTTCGEKKEHEAFSKKSVSPDGLSNKCKQCEKEWHAQHYQRNKGMVYQRNLERRLYLYQEVAKLKDHPCMDCGLKYEPFLMDFDHLSDKTLPVSKMIHEYYSLTNIKAEVAKCELVCLLCHKTRTHQRLQVQGRKEQWPCYDRNRAIVLKAKDFPCADCGVQRKPWQMEFDHLDPSSKHMSVSQMMGGSRAKLEAEIRKCQVLCSLCHRRKTKETLWDCFTPRKS